MTNIRLSRGLCAVVGKVLSGSHASLDRLFLSAGAPGPPLDLAHDSKWKEWLFRAGNDPSVDSLMVLGNVLEEFMDVGAEKDSGIHEAWEANRDRVVKALEENGLRYFRGGRVLPTGQMSEEASPSTSPVSHFGPTNIPGVPPALPGRQ